MWVGCGVGSACSMAAIRANHNGLIDVVLVAQRRRVVRRVEAVDLALGLVGIVEPDREHGPDAADDAARGVDGDQPVTQVSAPPRPATVKPRWSSRPRSNIAGLKPLTVGSYPGTSKTWSMTSPADEHGLAPVSPAGAEDQRRLETDDLLVERAVAVQIPCHHGDVADAARHARRAAVRVGLPIPRRRSPGWNDLFRAVPEGLRRDRPSAVPPATTARRRGPAGRCSARRCGPTRRGGRRAAAPGRLPPRSPVEGCAPR